MPEAPSVALAIQLRPLDSWRHALEMQLLLPSHAAPVQLLSRTRPSLSLPLADLTAARSNPEAYGRRLSEALFADPEVRYAWGIACAEAAGGLLHISLDLSACEPEIHNLRWETLQDPVEGRVGLALSERLLFSRTLASDALAAAGTRATSARTAVVAVASPDNLPTWRFDPLPVAAELARARQALGPLPVTVLGRPEASPCTADRLLSALRDGAEILCLVCHGRAYEGETYLWLEDEDGAAAPIASAELAARLDALPAAAQPALIVLAACVSGGADAGGISLKAAGPLLAGNGVTAVIAVNGALSLDTNSVFLPAMLREVLRDGMVDRAVAVARGAVRGRDDWWAPVLWQRLPHGRLWAPAPGQARGAAPGTPAYAPLTADMFEGRSIPRRGFETLRGLLSERAPSELTNLATLEERFERVESDERLYGSSENLRHERGRIVDSLNQLAMKSCGVSFVDLSRRRVR